MLDVGDGHTLYVHDWGNKSAKKPIIFLLGGPGLALRDNGYKISFNPNKQRVIFYEQRGCGKSTPSGELKDNNTQKSIGDIDKIADYLKIDKFLLVGGSWGSTLALAYAIASPKRVLGLVINGVFTGSKSETDWISNGGFKLFYPEVWEAYLDRTPKQFRDDPSAFHMRQIKSKKTQDVIDSTYAYGCMEGASMSLEDRFTPSDKSTFDPTQMLIEMTYLNNLCFMPDRYILDNASKITAPVWIVQGRYDMVCPPITTYELSRKLSTCKVSWTIGNHDYAHEKWNLVKAILAEIAQ